MNDLPPPYPPDEERLAALEMWLLVQLDHVRAHLAEARQRAAIQARSSPPPGPDYRLQRGLTADRAPVQLHLGDCGMAGKAPGVSADAARRALAEGVEACAVCRPDAELGWIDG
ncbi:DUF6233 domain-containing protein [Streptomyces sp. NPDC047097]|uniref:DUF6233 domain-containing protein n=1 Tax=Streptomyces sp. NPDC047097 TaxID=3155260 RepID=UPI0033E6FE52